MTRREVFGALVAFAACEHTFGKTWTVLVVLRVSPRDSYLCRVQDGATLTRMRIPVIDPEIFSDVEFAESVRDAVNRYMPVFLADGGKLSHIS